MPISRPSERLASRSFIITPYPILQWLKILDTEMKIQDLSIMVKTHRQVNAGSGTGKTFSERSVSAWFYHARERDLSHTLQQHLNRRPHERVPTRDLDSGSRSWQQAIEAHNFLVDEESLCIISPVCEYTSFSPFSSYQSPHQASTMKKTTIPFDPKPTISPHHTAPEIQPFPYPYRRASHQPTSTINSHNSPHPHPTPISSPTHIPPPTKPPDFQHQPCPPPNLISQPTPPAPNHQTTLSSPLLVTPKSHTSYAAPIARLFSHHSFGHAGSEPLPPLHNIPNRSPHPPPVLLFSKPRSKLF